MSSFRSSKWAELYEELFVQEFACVWGVLWKRLNTHTSLSLGKKGNFLENRGSLYKAATVKKKFFIFCII